MLQMKITKIVYILWTALEQELGDWPDIAGVQV
jgi:hypothetical protein